MSNRFNPAIGRALGFLPLVLLLAGAWCASQTAEALLWEIEGEKPSYLFGTIHLPDERVLALIEDDEPAARALAASDVLHTEIPMDRMGEMASAMMLEKGETLSSVLPEDLYSELKDYLSSKGVPIIALERFKIWVAVSQLALLDYIKKAAAGLQPLDMQLFQEAKEMGKRTAGLETIDEQVAVFESLSRKEQVELLRETLQQLKEAEKEGKSLVAEMVDIYLAGNAEELMELMYSYIDPEDPLDRKFQRLLLTDRNRRMADRIAEALRAKPAQSQFFAVGAAHLTGEGGIIPLLEAKGLSLRRVSRVR